jgi:hypothetical protein
MLALTVVHDFGPYTRGDKITDPALIAEIKDSENHANVVQVDVPDAPDAPKARAKS